jgi:hypothetical protein
MRSLNSLHIYPFCAVCHTRTNRTGHRSRACNKRGHSKCPLRMPLRLQLHSCWVFTTGFTENEMHIPNVYIFVHFKCRLANKLRRLLFYSYNISSVFRLYSAIKSSGPLRMFIVGDYDVSLIAHISSNVPIGRLQSAR